MPVISIGLTETPIDASAVLQAVEHSGCGATVLMTGQVRDHHEGRAVDRLEYQAYTEMAENELSGVAAETVEKWPDVRIAAVHRLGELSVGEVSVAVATAAAHRDEAFDACRFVVDQLKARLPIWKKEFGPGGEVWQEDRPLPTSGPGGEDEESR